MPEPTNADKTATPNEEENNAFDSFNEGDWSTEDAVVENPETKEDDPKGEKEEPKKEDSAVYQKRRYREQLRQAQNRIKELEKDREFKKQEPLSEDEQREQQARDAIKKLLREELANLDAEKSQAEIEAEAQLAEELEDVLDETDFTEKEILDICDELTVTPRKAVKILERERKGQKKPPTLPQPRKANPTVKEAKGSSPKTFEEAGRHIKDLLKSGKFD